MKTQSEETDASAADDKPKLSSIAAFEKKLNDLTKHNNNHHVVPIGIILVLCTLYIMIAGLQQNYICYFRPGVAALVINAADQQEIVSVMETQVLENEQPACQQMEVFGNEDAIINKLTKDADKTKLTKSQLIKRKSQETTSAKKSKKEKNDKLLEIKKKDSTTKKGSTAEPIIYLFALVFIYLLVKAVSDINQHYKSQNKGDKRLRRCSLQSYAQAHKQDRRASKDSPLRRKNNLSTETRSISVDRYKYTIREEQELTSQPETPSNLRKQISLGTEQLTDITSVPIYRPSALQQTKVARELYGSDKLLELHKPSPVGFSRRSSVPVTINYQAIQFAPSSAPPPLLRRSSIINMGSGNLTGLNPDQNAAMLETKRRVRMINRH